MRIRIVSALVALGLGLSGSFDAMAMPTIENPLVGATDSSPLIQDARVYCYNRYTGRFLHWGSCSRPVYRRPGRVYCYNRYTGRFLHWGHC